MKINKLNESTSVECAPVLDEELLVEGPISWIKDKFSKEPIQQKDADAKAQEKTAKQVKKRKDKKDPPLLAQDFSGENNRSLFYIDNKYDKPFDQHAWQEWVNKNRKKFQDEWAKIDAMPESDEAQQKTKEAAVKKLETAETKFEAQRYNSIVVRENGKYFRRGAEYLRTKYIEFLPGENDKISNGYFMEPYKYKQQSSTPKSLGKSKGLDGITKPDLQKFVQLCEYTGIVVLDPDGKQLDISAIKKLKPAELETHFVQVGSIKAKVTDWIRSAKRKKVI